MRLRVVDIMQMDLGEFIKELSELYDPDSKDSYLSLYLSKNINDKFIERRIRAISHLLKGEDLDNFTKTMQNIESIRKKEIGKNIAIFS